MSEQKDCQGYSSDDFNYERSMPFLLHCLEGLHLAILIQVKSICLQNKVYLTQLLHCHLTHSFPVTSKLSEKYM